MKLYVIIINHTDKGIFAWGTAFTDRSEAEKTKKQLEQVADNATLIINEVEAPIVEKKHDINPNPFGGGIRQVYAQGSEYPIGNHRNYSLDNL